MADDLELVTVESTSNPAFAQAVTAILKEAGIPTYVNGALLQDEWAMSRRLRTDVQVPMARLEDARRVLREARETGVEKLQEGSEATSAEPEEEDWVPWDWGLFFEVCVVLLVALIPSLFYSFASLWLPDPPPLPFAYLTLGALLHAAGSAALALHFIHRSREPWSESGFPRPRVWDILLAPVVWGFVWIPLAVLIVPVATAFIDQAAQAALDARLRLLLPRPEKHWQYIVLGLECAVVGFGEEALFRAYLIPRCAKLLDSEGGSLFLCAIAFGLGHAYQGALGVVHAAWVGLVFGAFFLVARRIWPLALVHAVNNFAYTVW